MKKTMMWAILALTAIVVMAEFNVHLFPAAKTATVPAAMAGSELYVCPAANSTWDGIARAMGAMSDFIIIGFFFAVTILLFVWGWAMYQNLLNDKFDRKSFSNPWKFTKLAFWAGVILLLLMATPNYFRRVNVVGAAGEWVLCENNTPGARPVRATAVQAD